MWSLGRTSPSSIPTAGWEVEGTAEVTSQRYLALATLKAPQKLPPHDPDQAEILPPHDLEITLGDHRDTHRSVWLLSSLLLTEIIDRTDC